MSKRGNGEGTIYKRADGRWVGSISLERARRKYFYGETRQEVGRKLTAALKARQDGLPVLGERQTVAQYLGGWLESIRPSVRLTTWERYESIVRLHVLPSIGRIPLTRLAPDHLQRLYAALQKSGLSAASVRQLRAILRKALNDATRWGVVARNVGALTTAPRIQRREMQALSPDAVRQFLVAAEGTAWRRCTSWR